MKLLRHQQLSAAGLQAQALSKPPTAPMTVEITPPQPGSLAAKVVTQTASPSYWPRYQAWSDNLWVPVLMPWEKAQMEGGGW